MRILRGILAAAAVIGILGPGLAQQAPGPDDPASALGLGLPSWWTVGTVEVQASVNEGDDISPWYRQRFTADVAPCEDLFRLVYKAELFSVNVSEYARSVTVANAAFSTSWRAAISASSSSICRTSAA